MDKRLLVALGLVVVMAIAVGFRFYDIQHFPPGLFPDEAANGEDALLVLDGDIRPFYPRGNGREGLFFILEALAIKYFGIGIWQLHVVSAAIGSLTVLAMYFATRVWFGRLSGLLAAGLLATNHWHVTMSRTGFRAILIPLFVALFTAWVGYTITSIKKGQRWQPYLYAGLAGAAFAGGFYTYIAYRVMIGVVLGIAILVVLDDVLLEWRRHRELHTRDLPHVVRYWRQLLVALAAAAIVFAPLAWFFVSEPGAFVGRAGQVSVFNEELQQEFGGGTLVGTVLYSTRETLLSFFAGSGDLNWRHNVAGFPLLNPLVGVLGLLGLAWAINGTVTVCYKIARREEVHLGMIYPYILLLIGGMVLPVITTAEGMPHGLRSIGLVVPIFFLAGTAGSVTLYWILRRIKQSSLRAASLGLAAGLLIVGVLYDGALYFVIARNDAEAHYAYRGDLTEVADFLSRYHTEHPDSARPYLALEGFSLQTVHFLTSVAAHEYVREPLGETHPDEHIWRSLDPGRSHLIPLQPGEVIVFTQSTMGDANRYAETYDNLELVETRTNGFGEEVLRVYGHTETPTEDIVPQGDAPSLDA